MLTGPERSPWRWPAAATALTIAAAHIPITPQHLDEAPYIGWSFVSLEVASVVLAIALVTNDVPLVWVASIAVPALAIGAYLVTRSVALPQIGDDVGNWTEPLGIVAVSAEALLVLVAAAHRSRSWRASRLAARPVLVACILLTVGLVATGCAATVSTG